MRRRRTGGVAAFLDPPKYSSIINTALNQTTRPIDRSSRDEIEGNTSNLLLYLVRSQCLEDKLKKHPHAIDTPAVAVDVQHRQSPSVSHQLISPSTVEKAYRISSCRMNTVLHTPYRVSNSVASQSHLLRAVVDSQGTLRGF
jgi:hypothetical protein